VADRIQKVLANAGLGSRREIERWVADGRVTVDGRVAKLGEQVTGRERVCVDGRQVRFPAPQREPSFLAYYKPSGRSDDDESAAELDLPRPKQGRWIDVAALDAKTSGLLVLTTDGELANRLMRPGVQLERTFAVRLSGAPSDGQLQRLKDGVELEDGTFQAASIEPAGGGASNVWYHVVLRESRQRGLRAAFATTGLAVSRVIRIRYGVIELGRLRRGETRPLTAPEIDALYAAVGGRPRAAAKMQRRRLT
jgi:23S rRNA pseudouridine2605 synthase